LAALRIAIALCALIGVGIALGTELPHALERAAPGWLLAAVALRALGTVTGALRWWFILRALGTREVGALSALVLSLEAAWLSLGLPTSIGGDVWRVHALRQRMTVASALIAALLDRALGAAILLGIAASAALWRFRDLPSAALPIGLVLATAAVLGLLAIPRIRAATRALLQARPPARSSACLGAGLFAGLTGAALIASHLAVALALDLGVPALTLLWAAPLILLARMVPLAPGGIGLGEATSVLLLARHAPPAAAVLFAFLGFAAVLPTAALGGVMLLGRPRLGALP
jgi:uncharacterized membrane protein YbhN (UPF0104 family)